MAKIKGTNGNDTLTGTVGDDFIFGYLGMDDVDGGAGYDVLTIDYSAVTSSVFPGSMALAADGTWSGGVSSGVNGGMVNVTAFVDVERVVYTASQDVDYLYVDLGTLALDATRLRLDGGAGDDVLSLNANLVDVATPLTLSVAADGSIKSNAGVFSNWDAFSINLGKGISNKLILGAGDDSVFSSGGKDILDLGAGKDSWSADYSARSDAVSVGFYSPTAGVSVFTAKSNLASVKNVETASIVLGSGDDTVSFNDGAGSVYGGAGDNTLVVQPTSATAGLNFTLGSNVDSGALEGVVAEKSSPTPFSFNAFRTVTLGGSAGSDTYLLDLSTRGLADGHLQVSLAAGGGTIDFLTLDLRAEGAVVIGPLGTTLGSGTLSFAGNSNVFDWDGIERVVLKLGTGDDFVNPLLAPLVDYDGGAGIDTMSLSTASTGQIVDLESTNGATVSGTVNIVAINVENVIGSAFADTISDNAGSNTIAGFDGNDTLYSGAASTAGSDAFYGGNGTDTIVYSEAASPVYVSLALTTAQNTGGGGTDALFDIENITGSDFGDTLSGNSGGNLLYGGDGNDILAGLGGNDLLYGVDGVDTATYAAATAAVKVSLAISGGQDTLGAGIDTLFQVENLVGSQYADTLTGSSGANRIAGGRGGDTLTGGAGADVFSYASTLDSNGTSAGTSFDRITDFSHAQADRINLSTIDAITSSTRLNDAFTFIGSDAFHGAAGELRVVIGRGGYFVYGDTDGDKVADLTIFVDGSTALIASDFSL